MDSVRSLFNLYVIIPVYNEAENLSEIFKSIRSIARKFKNHYRINLILVDDGSTDNTPIIAQKSADDLNITILKHGLNQGPGRAFGTAFENIASSLQADDWVLTMEGDNTSRLELLGQMLTRTKEGYDVILASPNMYGGGIKNTTVVRTMMSHVANAFVKEFLGIHGIHTMSSFFRLYRGSTVLRLQMFYGPRIIERSGFESMIELMLKLIYLKTNISEVPMVLDTSMRKGNSKMKIFRTIRGYLTLWKDKNRWRRIKESGT